MASSEAQEGSQIEKKYTFFLKCGFRMYQHASNQGGVKFEENPEPNNLHESTKVLNLPKEFGTGRSSGNQTCLCF